MSIVDMMEEMLPQDTSLKDSKSIDKLKLSLGKRFEFLKNLNPGQRFSLAILVVFVLFLPVGIWATINIKTLRRSAAVTPPITSPITTTPIPTPGSSFVIINETFDGSGPLDGSKWGWSGSVGSGALREADKLKASVTQGTDSVGGKDVVVFVRVNGQIVYPVGDIEASVDLLGMNATVKSGWQELRYGSSTLIVRRNKNGLQETVEAWTGRSLPDTKLASVNVPPNTPYVKVKIVREGSNVYGYYDLGAGFIALASATVDAYQSYQFPSLVTTNGEPDYPAFSAYFDNYYAKGNLTPIVTPTTSLSPTPIGRFPVISTTSLPDGKAGKQYRASVEGYDLDVNNNLTMVQSNLPYNLKLDQCRSKTQKDRKIISCRISGVPDSPGYYNVVLYLSDSDYNTTSQIITLLIN